ncbi:RagB/SusD family nutrient uptake outer membrane protein [Joostella atrarenae]|uniref:RagB/SusD family nutrient uptake outer membrane protein n=1 Tax=Joostella atrarenae TaxID=679257 RepID=A0ABS9J772_9FLAO|nr:RagB/SusD family nutrient uptake outer membrane protein [Joostella atrarenae]MCF8716250.1 RagB/SusD family nutrient uptake outer membrane protein [Joostella atrarenae]
MKIYRKHITALSIITLLTFSSCDEDKFLELENPNAITTDTFWETEKQFNSGLTAAYGALQFQNVSGGELQYEMAMGDIAGTESWYRPSAFRNLTFTDATYYVTNKWNELYIGVFRANQVIQYIQDADDSKFTGNSKVEIEAQAKFLRAFYYFQIANTYNGAIIHTKVAETDEELNQPFSSIEEVNNQVIIPDLEFARNNLPLEWSAEDEGRATWGAATSLLAKNYLYSKNWSQAASLFKEVIDSNIYALTPDIMDNFTDLNEFNSESIFEVAYSDELRPGVPGAAVDDTPSETGAEASTMANAFGQLNFGGYNTLIPTYYLHELFVNDEIDPTNSVNDGNTFSKRMNSSIVPINGDGLYYGLEIGEKGGWAFGQSAYIKKFTNWYDLKSEDTNSRSGINFRHIRLADVYLMYAEAIINASGDYNTAITYIDMVRSRAGVKTLQQYMDENGGKFPQLHISVQVNGSQPLVVANADNVMTHIQRVERPLELCYEGHRWKDLVRWGIVNEVFQKLRADEVWRGNHLEELEISEDGVAPLFIKERIRPDFFLAADNYTPEAHNYLPIPSQELQTNDQINN